VQIGYLVMGRWHEVARGSAFFELVFYCIEETVKESNSFKNFVKD